MKNNKLSLEEMLAAGIAAMILSAINDSFNNGNMNNETTLHLKKAQLEEAIKKEHYEKAAELRDEIYRIETINHQKKNNNDTVKK